MKRSDSKAARSCAGVSVTSADTSPARPIASGHVFLPPSGQSVMPTVVLAPPAGSAAPPAAVDGGAAPYGSLGHAARSQVSALPAGNAGSGASGVTWTVGIDPGSMLSADGSIFAVGSVGRPSIVRITSEGSVWTASTRRSSTVLTSGKLVHADIDVAVANATTSAPPTLLASRLAVAFKTGPSCPGPGGS